MRAPGRISICGANFRCRTGTPPKLDLVSFQGARSSAATPQSLQELRDLATLFVLVAGRDGVFDAMPYMVAEKLVLDSTKRRAGR